MTISDIKALIDANYPNNTTGLITPAKEREVLKSMVDFVRDGGALDGTLLSTLDFYEGRTIVDGQSQPMIYRRGQKDIIYQDGGIQVVEPDFMGNLVFTRPTELRGVKYADDGREFSITNRSGEVLKIRNNGTIENSQFSDNLDIPNDGTVFFRSSGGRWIQSSSTRVAFSDHLDSVNAERNVGSDGLDVWSGIHDSFTGKNISFKEINKLPNGQSPTDAIVNNLTLFKIGDKYLMNSDLIERPIVNVKLFGAKGDWVNDDTTAFQQAANHAKSIGASVYIPAGNYVVSNTTTLFHSCVFYGDGAKVSNIRSIVEDDKNVLEFFNTEGGRAGITLFGFSIFGKEDSTGTEGYGIRIHNSPLNTIKGISTRYLGGGAVWISDSYVNWMSECHFAYGARNTTYQNTDNAVVHVPYFPSGNNLNMDKVYISNNPNMDGVHFVGYNGNFKGVIVESGRDGIVIGQFNRPTRAININTCYFENSGGYDIRIVEAFGVKVDTTFHSNYPATLGNLFISNLRNAEFNNCTFREKGITLDTDISRSRNNIVFKQCSNVKFNTVNISGIKIENEVSIDEKYVNNSTNLISFSDDFSRGWTLNQNASLDQDATFIDGSPAWTVRSNSDNDSIVYSIGDYTGKLCFSCFVRIKSPLLYSKMQIVGRRKSDNVLETVAYTRLRQITTANEYEWERLFVSAEVDHTELTVNVNGRGDGVELFRAQLEKGVTYPSFTLYTNGWTITDNQKDVINGDLSVNGKLSVFGQSNSPYLLDIDNNGYHSLIPTTKQISDIDSLIQTGYYSTSGNKINSSNSYSLAPQKIYNYQSITISGVGGIATSVARIIFFDVSGNYLSNIMSTATNETVITFTPPPNAVTFAINIVIAATSTTIDYYASRVMLNYGNTALPVDKYAPQWKFDYQGNGGKVFRLREDEKGVDFIDLPEILSASPILDFPIIAANSSERLTTTVTGAAVNDVVKVTAPLDVYNANDSSVDAWVSAANTVTVRVRNNGSSSIDPGSGTYKIKVFK